MFFSNLINLSIFVIGRGKKALNRVVYNLKIFYLMEKFEEKTENILTNKKLSTIFGGDGDGNRAYHHPRMEIN